MLVTRSKYDHIAVLGMSLLKRVEMRLTIV
jgi:hypothetical protein